MSSSTPSVNNHHPEDNKNNQQFVDFLSTAQQFRVRTGNISAWGELKLRTFNNPSDELIECLRLQLQRWHPSREDLAKINHNNKDDNKDGNSTAKEGGGEEGEGFLLCQGDWCMSCQAIVQHARDELKITIKSFLSKSDAEHVRECLLAMNRDLNVTHSEQLIVALPPPDPDAIAPPSPAGQLEKMWPQLEKLVSEGHVAALGVADLMADDLRSIYQRAHNIKPLVNHYNIAACCAVPPELTEFAKQHDVVLLTHNDPHPFLTNEQVEEIFTQYLNVPPELARQWEASWAGRYTVMIKSRSVIAGKGYVVHFQKKKQQSP